MRLRPADHVRWAVNRSGVTLVDMRSGRAFVLAYPDAAVWDLLTRDGDAGRLTAKIARIADIDVERASRLVSDLTQRLRVEGLLASENPHG